LLFYKKKQMKYIMQKFSNINSFHWSFKLLFVLNTIVAIFGYLFYLIILFDENKNIIISMQIISNHYVFIDIEY
jgi:hypothetical protein